MAAMKSITISPGVVDILKLYTPVVVLVAITAVGALPSVFITQNASIKIAPGVVGP